MAITNIPELRNSLAAATTDEEHLRALIALSDRLIGIDHNEMHELALESFDLATRLNDQLAIADSLRLLGQANYLLGNYQIALEQLTKCRKHCEQFDSSVASLSATRLIVMINLNSTCSIANVHADMTEYAKALEEYRHAENILSEGLSLDPIASEKRAGIQINIGLLYAELGDYTQGLEHCQRALALSEDSGYKRGVASAAGNIGLIYSELGQHEEALANFQIAKTLSEEIGYRIGVAIWSQNIGNIYSRFAQYPEAIEQFRLTEEIATEVGDRSLVCTATGNIGNAIKSMGDYVEAMEYYQRSLRIAEEINSPRHIAQVTGNIGKLYYQQGYEGFNPALCIEYLLKAAEIDIAGGTKPNLINVYGCLADVYRDQGRLELALDYLRKHYELKEEVHNLEAHKKAQQFEHQRQIAKLEQQRSIEQAEAEIQRMNAQQIEKELGNTTLQLLAQTELLRDLRNDLLKIARKIPPSEPAARELRDRIKNLPCESVDWEKFDMQFKAVHPDFIRKLTERAPDLTATEVRICTMLRMNLKSHEMAQIFCISEAGVEFHRANIRRKLGLKREEKLPIVLGVM